MEEKKTKKPIYKRWWFIVLVILVILRVYNVISTTIENATKGEKINQTELILGDHLPKFPGNKAEVTTDTKECLDIEIYRISPKKYNKYLKKCKQEFNKDDSSYSDTLKAFNDDNYELYMTYDKSKKCISIKLDAPQELKKISWPSSEVAKVIPQPDSTMGRIEIDKSNHLLVHIGNTSLDEYSKYVNKCIEKGFNKDYQKNEKIFNGENSDGYELSIYYKGGNVMSIDVSYDSESTPEPSESATPSTSPETSATTTPSATPSATPSPTPSSSTSTSKSGMSSDFKKAMDSYEAFIDEYVSFMKKYAANPTDTALLSKYSSMMNKLSEQEAAFAKWNSSSLTAEEAAYYVQVQTRVSKKLLEV